LQHPVGQDAPSQTHVPPKQRWPVPQAALLPQEHAPFASHPSATVGSQLAHMAPGAPHAVTESGLQVAPAQQPLGHEVASHPHTPPVRQA
jgi:hypothetical protein